MCDELFYLKGEKKYIHFYKIYIFKIEKNHQTKEEKEDKDSIVTNMLKHFCLV